MKALLLQLSGGDRRSIGRANDVAVAVLADPGRLDELFAGLTHGDPLMRCSRGRGTRAARRCTCLPAGR